MADTLADPQKAVQETLSLLIGWKVVDVLEGAEKEEETFYFLEEEKKLVDLMKKDYQSITDLVKKKFHAPSGREVP